MEVIKFKLSKTTHTCLTTWLLASNNMETLKCFYDGGIEVLIWIQVYKSINLYFELNYFSFYVGGRPWLEFVDEVAIMRGFDIIKGNWLCQFRVKRNTKLTKIKFTIQFVSTCFWVFIMTIDVTFMSFMWTWIDQFRENLTLIGFNQFTNSINLFEFD